MTTAQFEVDFKNKLKNIYDDREASNISDWVFENITGLKRLQRRHDQSTLSNTQKVQLENYLEELLHSKPVQYVLKEACFYKRKFFVNEDTLIPRPETEELVGWVIHDSKETQKNKIQIIDIGTGSGCIPVSLKLELPDALIDAVDISEKAILVARENSKELQADVNFLRLDFLQDTEWPSLGKYDVIISNPPYIPITEKKTLSKNVADFEPEIALFVENNDPFIFYKKIVEFAQQHLTKDGKIYVEIHEEYTSDVKNIFENAGFITTIRKDIYGKERMVRARI
ncbi:MAG: peptide chain release factor N(5)-glutamine methyltransferase [Ginsengibacter sp.]